MAIPRVLRRSASGAILVAAILSTGCGSGLPPPRLSSAEHARVESVGRLGSVAIDTGTEKPSMGPFQGMLTRTGLFTKVLPKVDPAEPADYVARIEDRCDYRQGGWIPLLPIVTLGVVPQFGKFQLGFAFSLQDTRSGETIHVPCEIEGRLGVGWIPALMAVLPGWTREDPENTSRFDRRLAYSIVSRLPPASR
jgi:hypothetical protein